MAALFLCQEHLGNDNERLRRFSENFWQIHNAALPYGQGVISLEDSLTSPLTQGPPIESLAFDARKRQVGRYVWQITNVYSISHGRFVQQLVSTPNYIYGTATRMSRQGLVEEAHFMHEAEIKAALGHMAIILDSDIAQEQISRTYVLKENARAGLEEFKTNALVDYTAFNRMWKLETSNNVVKLVGDKYKKVLAEKEEVYQAAGFTPEHFNELPASSPKPPIRTKSQPLPLKFHTFFDVPRPVELLSTETPEDETNPDQLVLFWENYQLNTIGVEPLNSTFAEPIDEAVIKEVKADLASYKRLAPKSTDGLGQSIWHHILRIIRPKKLRRSIYNKQQKGVVKREVRRHLAKVSLKADFNQLVYNKECKTFPHGNFTINGRLYRYDTTGFFVAGINYRGQPSFQALANFSLHPYTQATDNNWIELAEDIVSHFDQSS